jgi:ABC-type lipoprotein export system ATPase subunit
MDLFGQLNREDGITIIVVTHDAEIARHARRVVELRDGYVLRDTPKADLATGTLHVPEEANT